ncbi:unnamed protein product [Coffea canephora]|uniref:DH200=94 genomic scaffold, scaffold_315 n=2 Tax=Coffea canephora TaxID=49390 RepID=A0A068VDN3_COFCA|nr:unnamed protein product [Coffea canephora]CDP18950.1 unnamed protein product [Coffea canephora]
MFYFPPHRAQGEGRACCAYSRDWMAYIVYSLSLDLFYVRVGLFPLHL